MAYRNTRSGRYKTFKHYLELPAEVRKMINDEMNPDDMCRFTRCSSLCNEEVKKSDKYIYGLIFDNSSEQNLTVTVNHARDCYDYRFKYRVDFRAISSRKFIKYSIQTDGLWRKLWKNDLDHSADLVQLASAYFKKFLEFYQNSIKLLTITRTWNYDVVVRSLNNLKSVHLNNCVGNIVEVISRRQKNVDSLAYYGEMNESFMGIDLFRVQKSVTVPKLKLNIEQFRRLSAGTVMIHIGEITPHDIFNFITSWKNGQLRENFVFAHFDLSDSNFNIQELWRSLEVQPNPLYTRIRIDDNLEAGRVAMVHYINDENERLIFRYYPHPIY